MACITAAQLVESCKNRLGWGYVLGGQGELYSEEMAQRFYDTLHEKSRDYYMKECAKWFGKYVVDCSGLIIEAFRDYLPSYGDMTANDLYNNCSERGAIGTIPEVPGVCVWKRGHIGIYVGGGKVIESRGKDYGVVETTLSARDFTNWGKLRDVDYQTSPAATPQQGDYEFALSQLVSRKSGTEDEIKAVQRTLNDYGYGLAVDGIFGSKTYAAVVDFQHNHGLKEDGIVGAKTCAALNGRWDG